jgi:hypothetical protein
VSRGGDWLHPPTRMAVVWFRDGGRCLVCGWRPDRRFGPGLVLDHVVPLSRWGGALRVPGARGPHDPRNLATMCADCHDLKGSRLPWELYPAPVWLRVLVRAARPLTRWHRRRGYLAAVRTGRYRRAYNAERCRARYRLLAPDREERRAIRQFGGG